MTYEEHVTRAALMGRVFDWRDGTYMDTEERLTHYIDAVTMEPVRFEECNKRSESHGHTLDLGIGQRDYEYWCKNNPDIILPWITSGGNDDG